MTDSLKNKPIIRESLVFLREGITTGRWKSGGRLPPLKDLAGMAGVSKNSMWKAVEILKKEGVLNPYRKKGIFLGPHPVHASAGQPVAMKWQTTLNRLKADILEGVFRNSRYLPSSKVMEGQYGVSQKTLKKAIEYLTREGYLDHTKSRLEIRKSQPTSTQNIVTIILAEEYPLFSLLVKGWDLITTLEKECRQKNLTFVKYQYAGLKAFKEKFTIRPECVGYIVWTIGMFEDRQESLILELQKDCKPIISIGEREASTSSPKNSRYLRPLYLSSIEAGRDAGNYLLQLGHRRIAFVSLSHQTHFSRERLRGLMEAFSSAGRNRKVDTYVSAHQNMKIWPVMLSNFTGDIIRQKKITAIIAVNDNLALGITTILKELNINVPADISVMGFDDVPEASINNISTYNFNFSGIGLKALNYLLEPNQQEISSTPVSVVPGIVMPRSTTAPPAKA